MIKNLLINLCLMCIFSGCELKALDWHFGKGSGNQIVEEPACAAEAEAIKMKK